MCNELNDLFIVDEDNAGKRLDVFLTENFDDLSRSYIDKLVSEGRALVNGKRVKSGYKIKAGDKVQISIPSPEPLEVKAENIDLDILYEDNDIIVINKPRGMVVHPAAGNHTGTLVNALLNHCKDSLSDINGVIRPGIVHRIDKDTSGVLVVAKNNKSHSRLSEKLKEHDIQRVYVALAEGIIAEDSGKIDAPIGRHPIERKKMAINMKNGRKAVTYFKVLERFKSATLVEARLETGRTHQIRVHLSFIGHPLVGDPLYGKRKQKIDFKGQALHAKLLGFVHPAREQYVEFEAALPKELEELIEKYRQQ